MVVVRYDIVADGDRWIVLRRTEDGRERALGRYGGLSPRSRARRFSSGREAEQEIETHRRADRGAATRLGLTLSPER